MVDEHDAMARFFDVTIGRDAAKTEAESLYRSLAFYRCYETLTSAYPNLYASMSQKRWERYVEGFLRKGIRSAYLWKVAGEFRLYMESEIALGRRERSILWFEWQIVRMSRWEGRSRRRVHPFHVDIRARLSDAVVLKRFSYDPNGAFSPLKRPHWLLIYSTNDGSAKWVLLTPFMGALLKALDKRGRVRAYLSRLANRHQIPLSQAAEIVQTPLQQWYREGIIVV